MRLRHNVVNMLRWPASVRVPYQELKLEMNDKGVTQADTPLTGTS